jgi:hypothetical protein
MVPRILLFLSCLLLAAGCEPAVVYAPSAAVAPAAVYYGAWPGYAAEAYAPPFYGAYSGGYYGPHGYGLAYRYRPWYGPRGVVYGHRYGGGHVRPSFRGAASGRRR